MEASELRADCARCAAWCCVATRFDRSPDFGCTKEAGVPCVHLDGSRCGIHADKIARGFAGCAAYECWGAGPRMTRTYGTWRDHPDPGPLFDRFRVVGAVHELLAVLVHARDLADELRPSIDARIAHLERVRDGVAEVDLEAERRAVEPILVRLRDRRPG